MPVRAGGVYWSDSTEPAPIRLQAVVICRLFVYFNVSLVLTGLAYLVMTALLIEVAGLDVGRLFVAVSGFALLVYKGREFVQRMRRDGDIDVDFMVKWLGAALIIVSLFVLMPLEVFGALD